MFGRKKDTISDEPSYIEVQSMPQEFYGGANPVITFHDVKKVVDFGERSPLSKAEQSAYNQTSAVGHHTPMHAANLLMSSKFIILGGVSLFLLFVAGAGGYYWYQNSLGASGNIPAPPVMETAPVSEVPLAPAVLETPTTTPEIASSTIPAVVSTNNNLLEFPDMALLDSVDMDSDGLSDLAEELFQTDPALPDSDNDFYSDAHEIFYLYNPAGKEPQKIIDAGTVKEYSNPVFDYTVYYPLNWAVGNTKEDYKDILFSTLGGDNIEVLTVEKESDQDFTVWFLQNIPSEQLSDYTSFESRWGARGWERQDKLVYFIVTPDRVYILAYHTSETNGVNYRIVLNMMARSFRLPNASDNMMPVEMFDTATTTVDTATSTMSATSTF